MTGHRLLRATAIALALLGAAALHAPAQAQQVPTNHVRGTLKAVQGHELTVQTNRGKDETIPLAEKAGLFLVTPSSLSAIKPGEFVGITSVEEGGKRVAEEVHIFAETLRGLGEGHYPWDLNQGPNMMTNANIAQVQEVGNDRVLKLNYQGGEQTIAVPPNANIVFFDKATPDQLVPGRKVFVITKKESGGSTDAAAVVIGAEGVKPPM